MLAKSMLLSTFIVAVCFGGTSSVGNGAGGAQPTPTTQPQAPPEERMIRQEVIVSAPLAEVWRAWTTSQGAQAYFAPRANIELAVGGRYELLFNLAGAEGSRGSEGCKVLSFLPMEMLSFEWNGPPSVASSQPARARTRVVVQFEELAGDRVKVKLTHLGMGQGPEWDKHYEHFSRAWAVIIENFKRRISGPGPGSKAEVVESRKQFLSLFTPSRSMLMQDATEAEQKVLQARSERLEKLVQEGVVILAGPCLDGDVSIVVFEARDLKAARHLMDADPAVQAGIFSVKVHPFRVALKSSL